MKKVQEHTVFLHFFGRMRALFGGGICLTIRGVYGILILYILPAYAGITQ